MFPSRFMVMVVTLKVTKNYLILHLKRVNFLICKTYLSKAIKKKAIKE